MLFVCSRIEIAVICFGPQLVHNYHFNCRARGEKAVLRSSFFVVLLLSTGCASVNSLPQSASEVDFTTTIEGKTGWSEYQGIIDVAKVDESTAYEAAKAGLRSSGFTLRRGDIENLTVIGAHGMTAYDWNVVAGVYIRTTNDATMFKIVVEGSKDIGFSGDATGSDWVGRIQGGIRSYLASSGPSGKSQNPSGRASATCFVVSPDGIIITNEHVIADANRVLVRLQNGREHIARTIAQSRNTDLARIIRE